MAASSVPTDALTGLPTRAVLEALLAQERQPAGVVLADMNELKSFNDRYGHAVGDEAICAVAGRIASAIEGSVTARFGGDEFVVILPGMTDEVALEWASLTIESAVSGSPLLTTGDVEVGLTVCTGAGQWHPGDDLREALARADERMQIAKAHRLNDPFAGLARLVSDVLDRASGVELLDAAAGAVAHLTDADLAIVVTDDALSVSPDFADHQLTEVAASAARRALISREMVEATHAGCEVFAAPLGELESATGAVAIVRVGRHIGKAERLALARAARLLGPSLQARRALDGAHNRIHELSALAFLDETTGIPNRRALLQWLSDAGDHAPLAVLTIDFDGLRNVNNELGTTAGDELIRAVAAEISRSITENEFAARLHGSGGDEFIVGCPGLSEVDAASRAAAVERRLTSVTLSSRLASLYQGASVGHSVRADDEPLLDFLERSAASMRQRKAERKSGVPSLPHDHAPAST